MNRQRQNRHFNDIDVVILCGGQGTRIRAAIGNRPKALADINGKPFLEILISQLVSHGFKRIILSVGYLKEQIKDYVGKSGLENKKSCEIIFSEEKVPLGTGGAIKNAQKLIKSDHFLVVNGDTIFPADFKNFYDRHLTKNALVSMITTQIEDVFDCGSVELADDGKIVGFGEKNSKGKGLASVGMYFMKKDVFDFIPKDEMFSLENDFFPKILNNNFYGFVSEGELIDIGTPERYEKAKIILSKI